MKTLRSLFYWSLAGGYFFSLLVRIWVRSYFNSIKDLDPWIKKRLFRLFRIIQVDLVIEFEEELPPGESFIFMANHSSLIDVPLLQAGIPRHFIGILAKHQFKFFLYGAVVNRLGHLAIDRSSPRRSLKQFQNAQAILSQGTSIVVLPEGGRSLDGHLLPFKKLPFRFARDSQTAIVPVSISGVFAMKPKGTWHLTPGQLVMRFGSIITRPEIESLDVEQLRERVYKDIYRSLERFEKGEQ